MLEIMYNSVKSTKPAWTFVFIMTDEMAIPKYGICKWRLEPINWSVLRDWQTSEQVSKHLLSNIFLTVFQLEFPQLLRTCLTNDEGKYLVTARCYCFITAYPFYRLHFGVLRDLLEYDQLGLKLAVIFPQEGRGTSRHRIVDLLENYHRIPVPGPGRKIDIVFAPELGISHPFTRSFSAEINHMNGDWGAALLVNSISSNALVLLLSALLQEMKLVLVSPTLRTLSCVICALLSLLRPLEWCSIVIPILPMSMLGVLAAPVPYIVGTTGGEKLPPEAQNEYVLVDLSTGALTSGFQIPLLPKAKELEASIDPLWTELQRRVEYCINTDDTFLTKPVALLWADIAARTCAHITENIIRMIPPCTARSVPTTGAPVTVLVKEVLLKQTRPSDRDFIRGITSTQLFNTFFAKYARSVDGSPSSGKL